MWVLLVLVLALGVLGMRGVEDWCGRMARLGHVDGQAALRVGVVVTQRAVVVVLLGVLVDLAALLQMQGQVERRVHGVGGAELAARLAAHRLHGVARSGRKPALAGWCLREVLLLGSVTSPDDLVARISARGVVVGERPVGRCLAVGWQHHTSGIAVLGRITQDLTLLAREGPVKGVVVLSADERYAERVVLRRSGRQHATGRRRRHGHLGDRLGRPAALDLFVPVTADGRGRHLAHAHRRGLADGCVNHFHSTKLLGRMRRTSSLGARRGGDGMGRRRCSTPTRRLHRQVLESLQFRVRHGAVESSLRRVGQAALFLECLLCKSLGSGGVAAVASSVLEREGRTGM